MDGHGQHDGGASRDLRGRVERLEAMVAAWQQEARTRRLVITDAGGTPRIVGQIVHGVAELRVEVPAEAGRETMTALFAAPYARDWGISSGVGLQLWADGECVAELDHWADLP